MHFFYLDEAGSTGGDLKNLEQPVFVLGGVSISDEKWSSTKQEFDKIVSSYFNGNIPDDFELHTEELLSPSGDGPFDNHARDRRNKLAIDILEILNSKRHNVHVYAIDKSKLLSLSKDKSDEVTSIPYTIAYSYLLTYIDWLFGKIAVQPQEECLLWMLWMSLYLISKLLH